MGVMADEIRGKPVNEAFRLLSGSRRKRTALILQKLLKSAVANADQKGTVDVDQLVVKELLVGGGPTLKRWNSRAKGSAFPIKKRTSNVSLTVSEK